MNDRDDSDGLDAVNVRLPDELLKAIDTLVQKGIFSSRSEAIREFCREYAVEARRNDHSPMSSTTTAVPPMRARAAREARDG